MIEPLIGRHRLSVDTVARGDRRDENIGAAQLDIDPAGAADDHAAQNILKPGRSRLRIGTAQVDVVPGHNRHGRSPRLATWRAAWQCAATCGVAAVNLTAGFRQGHPLPGAWPATAPCPPILLPLR